MKNILLTFYRLGLVEVYRHQKIYFLYKNCNFIKVCTTKDAAYSTSVAEQLSLLFVNDSISYSVWLEEGVVQASCILYESTSPSPTVRNIVWKSPKIVSF